MHYIKREFGTAMKNKHLIFKQLKSRTHIFLELYNLTLCTAVLLSAIRII
jgi:hypothetical protein